MSNCKLHRKDYCRIFHIFFMLNRSGSLCPPAQPQNQQVKSDRAQDWTVHRDQTTNPGRLAQPLWQVSPLGTQTHKKTCQCNTLAKIESALSFLKADASSGIKIKPVGAIRKPASRSTQRMSNKVCFRKEVETFLPSAPSERGPNELVSRFCPSSSPRDGSDTSLESDFTIYSVIPSPPLAPKRTSCDQSASTSRAGRAQISKHLKRQLVQKTHGGGPARQRL